MRRSKDEAEQTRTAILDAAERLFCEQGFAAATLEKISRAAGVTRGAFYWHFRDKLHVLEAVRARCKSPQEDLINNAIENGHNDPLGLLLETGLEMLMLFEADVSRQRLFQIVSGQSLGDEGEDWLRCVNEHVLKLLSGLACRARENGTLNSDFSPDEAAIAMMATMTGLLTEWLRSGKMFSLTGCGGKILKRQMYGLRVQGPEPATQPESLYDDEHRS